MGSSAYKKIRSHFANIYMDNQYIVKLDRPYYENLVMKRSLANKCTIIYIPNFVQNHYIFKQFDKLIASKYGDVTIREAGNTIPKDTSKQRYFNLYNSFLLMKNEMALTNALAFLSSINLGSSFQRVEWYLHTPRKASFFNFLEREVWDDSFIPCLAVMYVVVSFYEMTFKKLDLMDIGKISSLLLAKENIPDNVLTELDYLRDCILMFFKKIKIDVSIPRLHQFVDYDSCSWDGRIMVPWECVTFRNGYFLIEHPRLFQKGESGMAYRYKCEVSKTAFNYIKKSFIANLSPIIADCVRGKITDVFNVGDISVCVTALESGVLPPKVKIQRPKLSCPAVIISRDDYLKHKAEYKSVYLDYLSELISEGDVIYHCKECRITTSSVNVIAYEDAFLFRLTKSVLLYENVLDDRSSVVFFVNPGCDVEAIKSINEYFSSDLIENKRQKLAEDMTRFIDSGIKDYRRIYHNSFYEWKSELDSITRNFSQI